LGFPWSKWRHLTLPTSWRGFSKKGEVPTEHDESCEAQPSTGVQRDEIAWMNAGVPQISLTHSLLFGFWFSLYRVQSSIPPPPPPPPPPSKINYTLLLWVIFWFLSFFFFPPPFSLFNYRSSVGDKDVRYETVRFLSALKFTMDLNKISPNSTKIDQ
jgi:hypothetical protein